MSLQTTATQEIPPSRIPQEPPSWSSRYGERHRLCRITELPHGVQPLRKVRLYLRYDHFVLQWWDPAAKRTLSDRVDGDLIAAISRARQIDERIAQFRTAGPTRGKRVTHVELVGAYLNDLLNRTDAGDVDPATHRRYETALRHYSAFCQQPEIARDYRLAASVNREFRLLLATFLHKRTVSPNGRGKKGGRPMRSPNFVLETVRAVFEWGADLDRGGLLPEGFRNPFLRMSAPRSLLKGDPLAAPDITVKMAVDLLQASDPYQLQLFAPLLLFGLRASEPRYLFREHLSDEWLRVPCIEELGYWTKGRRDKRVPLPVELHTLRETWRRGQPAGLLFERRAICECQETAVLRGQSLAELVAEYRRRCTSAGIPNALQRQQIRNQVLSDAGGLRYDHIEAEFHSVAQRLKWPSTATLKDLRHLFATTMNNAGLPDPYRRYLLGQSPPRAAVTAYTHLDDLQRQYHAALQREFQPILDVLKQRCSQPSMS
jgi:hypothetical protein